MRHSGSRCPQPSSPHTVMGVVVGLGLTHIDMVQCRYVGLMKVVNFDGFDGVVSIFMLINTKYVVYNGWNVGILYSRDVYGGN